MPAVATEELPGLESPFSKNGFLRPQDFKRRSSPLMPDSHVSWSTASEHPKMTAPCSHVHQDPRDSKQSSESHDDSASGEKTSDLHPTQSEPVSDQDVDFLDEQPESSKGLFSWIRRFSVMGRRRTQSSIDMPAPVPVDTHPAKADVPRRSYSESELEPRRRVACEYLRPSSDQSGPSRRSTEDGRSNDDQYGRPSADNGKYAAIMKRRRKAYESLFANGNDNHFLNEELAARSSLFNSTG